MAHQNDGVDILPRSDNGSINVDKKDTELAHNLNEVVYKPANTQLNDPLGWGQKFQCFEPDVPEKTTDTLSMYLAAFTADLVAFCAGIGFSWTSPVLPKLHEADSPLGAPINASQESIIAAILCLGAAIGPFPYGSMSDRKGRKLTVIMVAIPIAIAFAILAFATDIRLYYLARLINGFAIGGCFAVLTMYIAEISNDSNRGKFSCLLGLFIASGVLYPFIVGPYMSIKTLCLSCLAPLALFLVLFTFYNPESPVYLTKIGDRNAAEEALMKLRSRPREGVEKEYLQIQKTIEISGNEQGGCGLLFKTRGFRKGFVVSAGLLVIQQLSGINAVTGYLQNIFSAAGGAIPPEYGAVLVGLIQVATMGITSSVIERLGRKLLLLMSDLGCGVSIILLGLYFFLQRMQFSLLPYFWWLPIVCLVVYIISFNLGLGPVSWTVLSEVFPSNIKSFASALASAITFGTSFVITIGFPIISEAIGMAETFWLLGACCLAGFAFTYLVVPETKGRTLTEIQEILSK
ncbi:facilitated trehalose transporter Tret1-like [Cylas formicarius]|uniref:facilitated trehalose transporter Tret1-like n=1 Tax=Cylas formicarius TaxID=197179 RepID=UPI002958781F|nr:facilitated trehalose transporter Tret1-like [Cylas formicarius]